MCSEEEGTDQAAASVPRLSPQAAPDEGRGPSQTVNRRMTRNLTIALLSALAVAAAVLGTSWMSGCDTAPVKPPAVVDPDAPLPPPDVGAECARKLGSMQSAVSIAKISAALLVSKDSKYGPAVKIALVAVDAALADAKAQCSTGSVDGWQVAMAAFDAAFAKLVEAGYSGEIVASGVPNDIGPPPPYAVSLDEFNAIAFELETSYEGVE